MARDLLTLTVTFGAGTGLALMAGAENLGTAMTLGQIAFAATLVALLLGDAREA